MDVYHLSEHLNQMIWPALSYIEGMMSFEDLLDYIKQELIHLFAQISYEWKNVASVLEVIGRDWGKILFLKDISKDLFINPVIHLGQLIKWDQFDLCWASE